MKLLKMVVMAAVLLVVFVAGLHAADAFNGVSVTADVVNTVLGVATNATSLSGFLHTLLAICVGFLISPVKQNLIENFIAPFVPWYAKAVMPLVLGSVLAALGAYLGKLGGISTADALLAATAATSGTYMFNGSSMAADKEKA